MADDPFPVTMVPNIERFFKEVHPKLKPGQLIYHEVFATENFFPLQRKVEMWEMLRTASAIKPETIMEIGADKGGSLYHWCMLPGVKKIIGCEIRGTPYAALFEKNFPDIEFEWITDSMDPKQLSKVDLFLHRDPLDVLFIDGDKSKFDVDFDLYRPFMNEGTGIVFVHDIRDPEPRRAFLKIGRRGYPTREIIDWTEYDVRMKSGVPPTNEWEGWLMHWRGRSCGVGVIDIGGGPKL